MTRVSLVLALLALPMEAGYLALRRLGDLRLFVVEYVAVSFAISLFYLVSCWWVTRKRQGSLALILLAGMAFRFTVLPLPPSLTEDPYRHRWEGKLQAAGGNPYLVRPADPRWLELRDRTWPLVNRKDLPTVYGPLIEWLHRGTYAVVSRLTGDEFRQVRLFKLPYLAFELATAAALAGLLKRLALPPVWMLIYFWSPPVVVEFWASGHNDSVAVFFVVLAVWAGSASRWGWAFGALWMAALGKFWPALLFPLFLWSGGWGELRRRMAPALAWAPLAGLVSFPFWGGVRELSGMLAGFLGGWHNNASLFQLVYLASGEDYERAKPWVALVLLTATLAVAWRRPPLPTGVLATVALLLSLSANCFPWYLTWIVPLLAVTPNSALLLWTALIPLAYHPLIDYHAQGIWGYTPLFLWLEYVPVYGLLIAGAAAWCRRGGPCRGSGG